MGILIDTGNPLFLFGRPCMKSFSFEKCFCFGGAMTSKTLIRFSRLNGKSVDMAMVAFNCFCDFLKIKSRPSGGC